MNLEEISVLDALPKYDEKVFLVGLSTSGKRQWFIGCLKSTDARGNHWIAGNSEIRDVTHWAYIPKLPKNQKPKARKFGD